MYLNKDYLMKFMLDNYGGVYRAFARDLGVEVSQLHRILNGDDRAGVVFLGRLHKYCQHKNVDYQEFIFFD